MPAYETKAQGAHQDTPQGLTGSWSSYKRRTRPAIVVIWNNIRRSRFSHKISKAHQRQFSTEHASSSTNHTTLGQEPQEKGRLFPEAATDLPD